MCSDIEGWWEGGLGAGLKLILGGYLCLFVHIPSLLSMNLPISFGIIIGGCASRVASFSSKHSYY
jgi:hypothetical protein